MIIALILKSGDPKKPIKDKAIDLLLQLAEERNTGPALIASILFRPKGLPKACEDFKHLRSRLETLTRLIQKFGFDGPNVPMQSTIAFASKNLESPNNEIRQAAGDLVLEAYKLVGIDTIEPMLDSRLLFTGRRPREHQRFFEKQV